MNVIGHARVSTEDQARDGVSIDGQIELTLLHLYVLLRVLKIDTCLVAPIYDNEGQQQGGESL